VRRAACRMRGIGIVGIACVQSTTDQLDGVSDRGMLCVCAEGYRWRVETNTVEAK
jgi:hypothetical protein